MPPEADTTKSFQSHRVTNLFPPPFPPSYCTLLLQQHQSSAGARGEECRMNTSASLFRSKNILVPFFVCVPTRREKKISLSVVKGGQEKKKKEEEEGRMETRTFEVNVETRKVKIVSSQSRILCRISLLYSCRTTILVVWRSLSLSLARFLVTDDRDIHQGCWHTPNPYSLSPFTLSLSRTASPTITLSLRFPGTGMGKEARDSEIRSPAESACSLSHSSFCSKLLSLSLSHKTNMEGE